MNPVSETGPDFVAELKSHGLSLSPLSVETLQVNITKLCNQACLHCHVAASPKRTESMSDAILEACLTVLAQTPSIRNLDITGGAPELHPRFQELVLRAKALGKHVMVRHNLTVTHDPHPLTKASMADLPPFFAQNQVEVVSSLPYYQPYFTNRQRGQGVFEKSIKSLKELNALGYGQPESGLLLNLVYNPAGAFLPAAQAGLEADYKKALGSQYGVVFNQLYTLTNMPIQRFRESLERLDNYAGYLQKLVGAFNPQAALGVMCRSLLSVGYDGTLYDCDFNQMLELPVDLPRPHILHTPPEDWLDREIVFGSHCYGCTAGAGSSCTGTTSPAVA